MVRKRSKKAGSAPEAAKQGSSRLFSSHSERKAFRDNFCSWAQRQIRVDPAAWQFHEWEIAWAPSMMGLFSKIPIPIDARLASALIPLRQFDVEPLWNLLYQKAFVWVYDSFCAAGRIEIGEQNEDSIRSVFSTPSAYEAFREGNDFRNGFADVPDAEFNRVCHAVWRLILDTVDQKANQVGRVLNLLAFPLGRGPVRSVPLIDFHWISEPVLELIVFSQMVRTDGLVCLPPVDPNSAAFERVFPKETVWPRDADKGADEQLQTLPSELKHEHLADYWEKAHGHVRQLKLRRRSVGGQPYLDAGKIELLDEELLQRTVRLGEVTETNTGVLIEWWNQWVRERSPKVTCKRVTVVLGELPHSETLPDRFDLVAIDDQERLGEMLRARRTVIQSLLLDCRNHHRESLFSEVGILDPSKGEKRIVRILFRRSMTAEQLAGELDCPRRTLFNEGWLPRLTKKGVVRNDRSIGGYYLPAFPPA